MSKAIKSNVVENNELLDEITILKKKLKYKVLGTDLQLLEITLRPGESVIGEAGAMTFMDSDIKYETIIGNGSDYGQGLLGKVLNAASRVLTKESLFVTKFMNISKSNRIASFAAPYPGNILDIDLSKYGNEIICQKDSFMCAESGTDLRIMLSKKIDFGCFGEGFILQKLSGEGHAFIHAGGTIIEKELDDSEIVVDTGSVVAFTKKLDYDIKLVRGIKSMMFAKEGLFLTSLRGTGTVWIQSLPFNRFAEKIARNISPSMISNKKG